MVYLCTPKLQIQRGCAWNLGGGLCRQGGLGLLVESFFDDCWIREGREGLEVGRFAGLGGWRVCVSGGIAKACDLRVL